MPIIRQGIERTTLDTARPTEMVELLRGHLRTEADRLPADHKDRVPLLGQFRGLGQERKYGYHFITLITALGGVPVASEWAQSMHSRLDIHRRPASDDPEQKLMAGASEAIAALPHDHDHPAIKIGTLLVEGLAEERSPAVRWAVEALLAVRLELANDMRNSTPNYPEPIAA